MVQLRTRHRNRTYRKGDRPDYVSANLTVPGVTIGVSRDRPMDKVLLTKCRNPCSESIGVPGAGIEPAMVRQAVHFFVRSANFRRAYRWYDRHRLLLRSKIPGFQSYTITVPGIFLRRDSHRTADSYSLLTTNQLTNTSSVCYSELLYKLQDVKTLTVQVRGQETSMFHCPSGRTDKSHS